MASRDTDGDLLPDADEATLEPGRPYNSGLAATYIDTFGYHGTPGTMLRDIEDVCLRRQPSWANGSANTEDWASPGMQHQTLNDPTD